MLVKLIRENAKLLNSVVKTPIAPPKYIHKDVRCIFPFRVRVYKKIRRSLI